jgi:hypothetical protein
MAHYLSLVCLNLKKKHLGEPNGLARLGPMSLAGRAQLERAWLSSGRAEKLGLDVQIYAQTLYLSL